MTHVLPSAQFCQGLSPLGYPGKTSTNRVLPPIEALYQAPIVAYANLLVSAPALSEKPTRRGVRMGPFLEQVIKGASDKPLLERTAHVCFFLGKGGGKLRGTTTVRIVGSHVRCRSKRVTKTLNPPLFSAYSVAENLIKTFPSAQNVSDPIAGMNTAKSCLLRGRANARKPMRGIRVVKYGDIAR